MSLLFSHTPKLDNQLPVLPDGGLLDIHLTAFVSAIDSLLTASCSNVPARTLGLIKPVVNAVSAIIEDVRLFERRQPTDLDLDVLRSLAERVEATLKNLVTASKTHWTKVEMSPASLLDATANDLSATVTEIVRTLCVRRASRAEQQAEIAAAAAAKGSEDTWPELKVHFPFLLLFIYLMVVF
jgi:hypothetical protein